MTEQFFCSYLGSEVELTQERKKHILQRHPDLPTAYLELIADTLNQPDQVRRDVRFENTLLFSRWFATLRKGKYAVVAVVSDTFPLERHWIVTAYISRKITQGEIIWTRS
ncbi:hypothetical protein DP113_25775 [Brasilonema octagenarum UFV-E1]|uniref:Phage-Barnase-EndoU-ColicinE5/D-RelE like nuclease 2 domain-containing protein n=1 Tax=Brasilonema sennae CENA114 TaxID=415709 RepID=A0A856MHZ9_9CYAN|nr:hypothetical protein [Brasilonema sennae]QDL10873.1 hypothetical protein DP114_25865 [Brasilonema sennae CENA114]QDL17218.1 hypothetical protein DP113_25775 [Brasilonema octagenarum UFV-E1]